MFIYFKSMIEVVSSNGEPCNQENKNITWRGISSPVFSFDQDCVYST